MRSLLWLLLLSAVACSTGTPDKKKGAGDRDTISKETFTKAKPLSTNQVADFYQNAPKTLRPSLQDETIDNLSVTELSQISSSPDPLVELSLNCSNKNYSKGLEVASKIFQRYQKIPAYWNIIGNCYLGQGEYRKALLFYNKALESKSNYVPALNNIGVLYSIQGDDQKALVAFEKANKASPFSKTPRYNLARLYLSYGLASSAMPLFKGLLNDSPTDVDLLNALATANFMQSDYQQALSYFNQIPASELQSPEFGLNYSITLKKTNQSEKALQVYKSLKKPASEELNRYYVSVGKYLGVEP
jgi:tetratricopeptide (TPR) repeat protein